jgi:hypothetical protein
VKSRSLEAGASVPLFAARVGGAVQALYRQQYIVSKVGQRFLMNTDVEESTPAITMVLNWHPGPRK